MIKEEHEVAIMGAPQGPGPVMSTVVNIQPETAVPDHIVWSLFNSIYCNVFCLGLVAFAYSVKMGGTCGLCPQGPRDWGAVSRDRKMVGDVTGAQSYASTAKRLHIWALLLGLLGTIGFIVLLVFVLPTVSYAITQAKQNHGGY